MASLNARTLLSTIFTVGTSAIVLASDPASYYAGQLRSEIFGGRNYGLVQELRLVTDQLEAKAAVERIQQMVNTQRQEHKALEQSANDPAATAQAMKATISTTKDAAALLGVASKLRLAAGTNFVLNEVIPRVLTHVNKELVQGRAQELLGLEGANARYHGRDVVARFVALLGEPGGTGQAARDIARRLGYDRYVGAAYDEIVKMRPEKLASRLSNAEQRRDEKVAKALDALKRAETDTQRKAVAEGILASISASVNEQAAATGKRQRDQEASEAWQMRGAQSGINLIGLVLSTSSDPNVQKFGRDFVLIANGGIALDSTLREYKKIAFPVAFDEISLALNITSTVVGLIQGVSDRPEAVLLDAMKQMLKLQAQTYEAVAATLGAVLALDRKVAVQNAIILDKLETVIQGNDDIVAALRDTRVQLAAALNQIELLARREDETGYGQVWTDLAALNRKCLTAYEGTDYRWVNLCIDDLSKAAVERARDARSRASAVREDDTTAYFFPIMQQKLGLVDATGTPETPNPDVWLSGATMLLALLKSPDYLKSKNKVNQVTLLRPVLASGRQILAVQRSLASDATRNAVRSRYDAALDAFLRSGLPDAWARASSKLPNNLTNADVIRFTRMEKCTDSAPTIDNLAILGVLQSRFGDWVELEREGIGRVTVCGELNLRVDSFVYGQLGSSSHGGRASDGEGTSNNPRIATKCNATLLAKANISFTLGAFTAALNNPPSVELAHMYDEFDPKYRGDCPSVMRQGSPYRIAMDEASKRFAEGILRSLGSTAKEPSFTFMAEVKWPGLLEAACADDRCKVNEKRREKLRARLFTFREALNTIIDKDNASVSATAYSSTREALDEQAKLIKATLRSGALATDDELYLVSGGPLLIDSSVSITNNLLRSLDEPWPETVIDEMFKNPLPMSPGTGANWGAWIASHIRPTSFDRSVAATDNLAPPLLTVSGNALGAHVSAAIPGDTPRKLHPITSAINSARRRVKDVFEPENKLPASVTLQAIELAVAELAEVVAAESSPSPARRKADSKKNKALPPKVENKSL